MTTTLVEMRYGSHLFGTATPTSDTDIKAVHLPSADEILLGTGKPVITQKTKVGEGRNTADDIDHESYSLQKYLALLVEGQTVALDMLFAPDWAFIAPPHEIWRRIQANRARLLSRRHNAFVGYCRAQANKFGAKGSRVAASRAILELLERAIATHGRQKPLSIVADEIRSIAAAQEHVAVVPIANSHGLVMEHLRCCDRKCPFNATLAIAHDVYKRLVDNYGQRALQAESNQGVDWKALSHAVRISEQAVELLVTGHVTFPRPNAAELLEIKTGQIPYAAVVERIDAGLAAIEEAAASSPLPEEPDHAFIRDIVLQAHGREVIAQATAP